MTTSRCYALTA